MMDPNEFELLSRAYGTIVTDIINSDVRFFRFHETIKWCFGYEENTSIMASCNRMDSRITINLKAFMAAYFRKDMMTIEFYLLHEIRHAFQHSVIADYQKGLEIPIGEDFVKRWIDEGKNYVTACDANGNENADYFLQDCEMDAYAFSYAVMKYKYHDISHLYIPGTYGTSFFSIVDEWIETFNAENL